MNLFKKRNNVIFTGEPPLTPYQMAQKEWDDRIGSARAQARNWRLISLLSLTITLLLIVLLIMEITTKQERIFVAEVTKTGQVVNVVPLRFGYNPTIAQKEYFLTQFVDYIRGVPLDPVVAKQNWLKAYRFLAKRGAEELNTYLRKENPLTLLGKQTVTIKINDINQISELVFQVDWTETSINLDGKITTEKHYSGVFTIAIHQPTNQQEILQNPLGIYIVDFHVSTKEV